MSRSIVPWPHPCLRRLADPIEKITPEIEEIWRDMIAVMEAMPGVGLAEKFVEQRVFERLGPSWRGEGGQPQHGPGCSGPHPNR